MKLNLTDEELIKLIRDCADKEIQVDPVTKFEYNGKDEYEIYYLLSEMKVFLNKVLEIQE